MLVLSPVKFAVNVPWALVIVPPDIVKNCCPSSVTFGSSGMGNCVAPAIEHGVSDWHRSVAQLSE